MIKAKALSYSFRALRFDLRFGLCYLTLIEAI